jgi:WD40 repeat protein
MGDSGDSKRPRTDAGAEAADDAAQWHVAWSSGVKRWGSTLPLPPTSDGDNFAKGVKWSADGNFLLSGSEDHTLRLWEMDCAALPQAWTHPASQRADGAELPAPEAEPAAPQPLHLARMYPEGECVYDFCWYPLARKADSSSCCVRPAH